MEYRVSINVTKFQQADNALQAAQDALAGYTGRPIATPKGTEDAKVVITVVTPRFYHEPIRRMPEERR